jgi:hypothetical protein
MIEHTDNRKKPRLNTYSSRTLFIFTAFVALMLGSLPFLPSVPPMKTPFPQFIFATCWIFATFGAFLSLAAKSQLPSERFWYYLMAASALGTWGSFFQTCFAFAKEAQLHPQFPGAGLVWMIPAVGIYAAVLAASMAWLFPTNHVSRPSETMPSSSSIQGANSPFVTIDSLNQLSVIDRLLLGIAIFYLCICLWMMIYEPCVEKLENLPSPVSFLLGLPWSPLVYLSFLFCPTNFRVPLLLFVYTAPPIINVFRLLCARGIRFKVGIMNRTVVIQKQRNAHESHTV